MGVSTSTSLWSPSLGWDHQFRGLHDGRGECGFHVVDTAISWWFCPEVSPNRYGHILSKLGISHQAHTVAWLLLFLFLTFSVLVANPKKLLYTVANPARGLLNREKKREGKILAAPPPPPAPPRCSFGENKITITRRIYRHYAGLGSSRVRTKDSFDSSTRLKGVASQNYTLLCAITSFPASLPLSSLGDV